MVLTQTEKQQLITDYQVHETDTGSAYIQVAILTTRINQLTEHLKNNDNDHSSRLGLLKIIGRRKGLLRYIHKHDPEGYQSLIKKLSIRG